MAPPPGTLRVGRYFAALIVLLGLLYLVVGFPGNRHTPKLGIDLVGGKRVIFTARTGNGTAPTSSSMNQARQIIEDRINGTGVTGATVQVQGGNQLVVLIPGGTDTDVAALGQPAVLNFRPLVTSAAAVSCVSATSGTGSSAAPSASPSVSSSGAVSSPSASVKAPSASAKSPNDAAHRPLAVAPTTAAKTTPKTTPKTPAASGAKPSTTGKPSGSAAATGSAAASPSAAATTAPPQPCLSFANLRKAFPGLTFPTTEAAFGKLSATQQAEVTAALGRFDCASAQDEPDQPKQAYIACDDGSSYGQRVAYLLGSVIVKGSQIDNASAQAPSTSGQGTTEWTVALNLKSSGSTAWGKWTGKYNTNGSQSGSALQCGPSQTFPCSDWVGFTLNGQVISAPVTLNAINGGTTQISGNFSQGSANNLATQLNYGSLPLSFRTDANESVSATLGSVQLKAAFLAGGIGLALVVLYSLLYYRGLGLVTIASLLVSAGFTYAMLVILGSQIGFTLDLAGIAGFIVALGITADSFVVFFERIKDEVHEGRSMRVAVPRAWIRARRTILSADTVSFLAAAILYYFASADVKGFAFTLGLSTILDLVVVFLFTHPIVSLLSRSRAFGSKRFTGLDSVRSGPALPDEAPDRRSARPARAGTPRRAGGTAAERAAARRGTTTGVAVLDRDTDAVDDTVDEAADDRVDDAVDEPVDGPMDDASDGVIDDALASNARAVPTAPADDAASPDDTADEDDGTDAEEPPPSASRRRTAPSGGTAAERAAARRARMRQRDEKGES